MKADRETRPMIELDEAEIHEVSGGFAFVVGLAIGFGVAALADYLNGGFDD